MTVRTPNLGIVAARGVFWTGGGQIIRQVIQVLTSIMLARLLAPDDFGLLGMALVFTGFAQLFLDFGIGMAIVQARDLNPKALSSCFWVNLGITIATVAALVLASPLIAAFYNRPDLTFVVVALAVSLLVSGSGVVSGAILNRDMQFDKAAKAQVIGTFAGAGAAVACASCDMGVWSLVVQQLVGFSAGTFFLICYASWYPRLEYSWGSIRGMVAFGSNVFGTGILNFAHRNTDTLLIGRFLGSGPLGYYSFAYQLMLYPLAQVSGVIVRVLFPTLSRLQVDMDRFRSAYLKCVSAIALITFPMMAGLYTVSEDFIIVVFGEKWLPMQLVLQVLCWVGFIQSLGTTVGVLYLSLGKTKVLFRISLTLTPIFIAAFVCGLPWGIEGVATAYAVTTFTLQYVTFAIAFRIAGITFHNFHASIARPLFATSVMMVGVVMIRSSLLGWPPNLRLTACIASGVLIYLTTSMAMNREQLRQLMSLTKAAALAKQ